MIWKKEKICDLCSVITKGTTPSNVGETFTDTGIKYIRSEMLTSSKFVTGEFLHISPETHEKLKRSQLKEGDILFSMAGVYLGKTAILRTEDVPSNTNQATALIRVNKEKCNNEYVYYYLNIPEVVKTVNAVQSQSAQPNINLKQIGQLEINIPTVDAQEKIVHILSSYDNLIENNQKQIKLLEEAAQRLYKEWFVDLRFPGYENVKFVDGVPEGWRKDILSNVALLKAGGDKPDCFAKEQDANHAIPVFSNGTENEGLYGYTDKASILDNSVTVSARGSVGYTCLRRMPYFPIVRLIAIIPQGLDVVYLYLYLRNYQFDSNGVAQQQITVPMIKKIDVLIPTKEIINDFIKIIYPIYDEIDNHKKTITKLIEARERLLPKLMSGELEV